MNRATQPNPTQPNPTCEKAKPDLFVSLLAFGSAQAQTAATVESKGKPATTEEAIVLNPFVVSTEKDNGLRRRLHAGRTRLNTPVKDVGAASSIYTRDFLTDIGATNANDLLIYATGVEAAGPGGNFANATGGNINNDQIGDGSRREVGGAVVEKAAVDAARETDESVAGDREDLRRPAVEFPLALRLPIHGLGREQRPRPDRCGRQRRHRHDRLRGHGSRDRHRLQSHPPVAHPRQLRETTDGAKQHRPEHEGDHRRDAPRVGRVEGSPAHELSHRLGARQAAPRQRGDGSARS